MTPGAPSGGPPPADGATPKPAPVLALNESSMLKKGENAPPPPGGAGSGKLGLPTNSLAPPPSDDPPPPASSSAQASLDDGIDEQQKLLEEFAKVSDQLGEILASLEASTFVKRFKAASRHQMTLASELSQRTLDAFGVSRETPNSVSLEAVTGIDAENAPEPEPAPEPELALDSDPGATFVTTYAPIASRTARDESQVVKYILTDMQAYYQRRQDFHFKKVINEMKETRVVQELARVGDRAEDNYNGNAIHAAELWADTMDRWAEEMVAVGKAFC